jgi:hypothetical protein
MHIYWPQKNARNTIPIIILITATITIVVGFWIWQLFWKSPSLPTQDNGQIVYVVGDSLTVWGDIKEARPLTPYFTHTITNEIWDIFWIKSADIDLSQYTNPVQIRWTIDEIRDWIVIIKVTAIEPSNVTNTQLSPSNPQYYWFKKVGIGIDLSSSQWFALQETANKDIVFYDTKATSPWEREIFTITPFTCTPNDPLRDCVALRRRFQSTNPENFIAGSNLTYYKLPDTETWVTFTEKIWFFLAPRSSNWSSFTSLITFLTEETIKAQAEKEMSRLCKDTQSSMSWIATQTINEKSNSIVEIVLTWPSSRGGEAECRLDIRLWSKIQFFLNTYTLLTTQDTTTPWNTTPVTTGSMNEKPESASDLEWNSERQSPDTSQNEIPQNQWENQLILQNPPRPWAISWWVSFPSVRWYTVYFSNPRIRYGGTILTTPEIFWWLVCTYKIDVALRVQDQENTEPSTIIYECRWVTTSSQLENNGLQPIFQEGTLIFVANHRTDALKNMAIYVEMNQ